jgi:GNAT superfamily N-acetyltransferase
VIRHADEVEPDRLWAAFLAAFADYLIGAPDVPRHDWPGFLDRQGADLGRSRVVVEGDEVTAFALIAPMPGRSRLAVMGARPAARGTGAARQLLDLVVEEARARGDASMELEVFAQNTPAVRLYQGRGFVVEAELPGFVRMPAVTATGAGSPGPLDPHRLAVREVTIEDAMEWLAARADGLPHQVSAAALPAATGPLIAWRSGEAQLVWARRSRVAISIVSFVDDDPARAGGRSLLRALAEHAPEATLRAPQLQRLDRGGLAFEEEGWRRQELHQLLLRRTLHQVMLDP